MIPATTEDCPMTAECPGYDGERGVCLVRAGDCEFAPQDREPDQPADGGTGDGPQGLVGA